MKTHVMNAMQSFSKAMFIPVLILPIAGLLIAIGNIFTNTSLQGSLPFLANPVTIGFGSILSGSLVSILNNLGLIFCVGIAVGLARKKKSDAGFTAVLAYLVFINAMNQFMALQGMLVDPKALEGSGQTSVLGTQILDMGVFIGIILGLLVAAVHNRFIDTEFTEALSIYGGTRFVFIVSIPAVIVLAIALTFVWPVIQRGIDGIGFFINQTGNFGVFVYGALERLLIPTGLHHLVYTPFLYSKLGGTADIAGHMFEGARNIYYAQIADPATRILSGSVVWDARGISKMFGLMGACLAIYRTAKPENRLKVKAILIPAAFCSFIAGVTEPIEFSFMFVAPILFVVHAALSGLGMVAFNVLGCRAIAPNGFIDFILYNVPLGAEKTHWPVLVAIGAVEFVVYYLIFRLLITRLNLKTLGREDDARDMKLHSKAEYREKVALESSTGMGATADGEDIPGTPSRTSMRPEADRGVAGAIISALGGADNICKVDNCYTRLRLILADPGLVSEDDLKEGTGAVAVIKKGENVQVVYGPTVRQIRTDVDAALGREDDE